jgi:hypothetical protein
MKTIFMNEFVKLYRKNVYMNGLTVLKLIRQKPEGSSIVIDKSKFVLF